MLLAFIYTSSLSLSLSIYIYIANTHTHTHTHTHAHHTHTHTHTQAESQEWTKEIRDSEEVANITFADMENFKRSEESHFFTSGEEIRLLLHTIQNTPYDTVSVDACTVCSSMCILSMAKYRILKYTGSLSPVLVVPFSLSFFANKQLCIYLRVLFVVLEICFNTIHKPSCS